MLANKASRGNYREEATGQKPTHSRIESTEIIKQIGEKMKRSHSSIESSVVGRPIHLLTALVAAFVMAAVVCTMMAMSVSAAEESRLPSMERIQGGKPAPDSKYPFMAALVSTKPPVIAPVDAILDDRDKFFCGGTLINRDSVLTAAHCLKGETRKSFRVAVGRTVLSSNQGQMRGVSKIHVHRRYGDGNSYDVAVIKLKKPVKGIRPIELATAKQNRLERPGSVATISGWGATKVRRGRDVGSPNRMREAKVKIVSDAKAKRFYRKNFQHSFQPKQELAAGKAGVRDTRGGDSGGPLFRKTNGGYTQIGVTSWGENKKGSPGVYAEVNSLVIERFIDRAAKNKLPSIG